MILTDTVEGVVLAAGRGERLRPLTDDTPKPLLKVGDKSLLEYQIQHLINLGVAHLTVVIGYRANQVCSLVNEKFGDSFKSIRYIKQWRIGCSEIALTLAVESSYLPLILCLCGDDLIPQSSIELMINYLNAKVVASFLSIQVDNANVPRAKVNVKNILAGIAEDSKYPIITYNFIAQRDLLIRWMTSNLSHQPLIYFLNEERFTNNIAVVEAKDMITVNTYNDWKRTWILKF